MLARVRARLTYANVVATLALFLALGGTSYAVSQITSRDVKNRSLKGGDLRRDTLTGKEIRESTMREVPSARLSQSAATAASADVSKSADQANVATTAGSAGLADVARDAQALAGQGAGAFERSSRTQFGRGDATPASSSAAPVLLSWPALGAQVATTDACAGGHGVEVRNTRTSGPGIQSYVSGGPGPSVLPSGSADVCAGVHSFDVQLTDATGRALFVQCIEFSGELRCIGTRSAP